MNSSAVSHCRITADSAVFHDIIGLPVQYQAAAAVGGIIPDNMDNRTVNEIYAYFIWSWFKKRRLQFVIEFIIKKRVF